MAVPPAHILARRMLRALLAALLIVATSRSPASAAGWQVFLGGNDDATPQEPSGVAIDSQGYVYIVDTGGSRIEKLTPSGRLVQVIGHVGTGQDALRRPRGITIDVHDNLWVADTANHRVQRFSSDGEPLGSWGEIGSGPGELILPTSLALDSTGNVYVADTGNHRVQQLTPDGRFVREWGGVHFPHGIAIDGDDGVWVTDESGVREFSGDGALLQDLTAPGRFADPYAIAFDQSGSAYVADTDTGRILVLSHDGHVTSVFGGEGTTLGRFHFPEAIAVDSGGAIYVADRGNNRVQVFRP
jgi:DNA-binding beta-propeller fold protein YncE